MAIKRRKEGKPIPPDNATILALDALAHMVISGRNNATPKEGGSTPVRKIRRLRKN